MDVPAMELQWVHPPLQERSQQTMERLLGAAESLTAELGFEHATVAAIARRAKSSVGAFYARFKDKDALLRCLIERFVGDALATSTSAMRPELWRGLSIETACRTLIVFLRRVMGEKRQLIRAIAQYSLREPDLQDYRNVITAHCVHALSQLVAARHERFGCSDPERALRMVVWTCLSVAEASALGEDKDLPLSSDDFESELCQMILSHLQIHPIGPGATT